MTAISWKDIMEVNAGLLSRLPLWGDRAVDVSLVNKGRPVLEQQEDLGE
jgi:hypothetical protein